jgi:hypothetical protein
VKDVGLSEPMENRTQVDFTTPGYEPNRAWHEWHCRRILGAQPGLGPDEKIL